MKQAFIILAIALTTQACDQTCQSKCIKQNKGKNCLDLCNCESLPPPLEEFIAKGSSYSLPKIRQDEKLWAERELGCDVTSLEICLKLAQKGEDKYQCAIYSGCEDLLVEQKKGQIIEVITENECEHTCEMLCIGISEDNSCRFRCRKRFCEGKQVETDGNLFIAAQLTLILAAVVSLMLIISRSLASRYSRKERLL